MAEQIDLTTPIVVSKTTDFFRVVKLGLDWRAAVIAIVLEGENGELQSYRYEGSEATTLMIALNKANLSATSLQRRILNRLIADGRISGTVSGSPD